MTRFAIRDVALTEICFRPRDLSFLSRSRVIESMTEVLKIPGVRIEVMDMSGETAPVGRIDFQRENLRTPANPSRDLTVVWRGDIIYAGDRRFAIWARVKLTAPVTRLIAVENLRPGVPINPGQLREEVTEAFPLAPGHETKLSQIDGLVPIRTLAAGTEIRAADLIRPSEVNRGDLVHVEVRMGAARVALTGRAESAGRLGELVPIRNLESSRVFQARVEEQGQCDRSIGPSGRGSAVTVILAVLATALLANTAEGAAKMKSRKPAEPSALDQYIQASLKNATLAPAEPSAGSLWTPASRFTDVGADLRAVQVNDLVTIIVSEQASAVATGATKTSRVSSVNSAVTALAGIKSATGALANLANSANDTELNGAGSTSQGTSLSSTLSARVTHVLPNGYLVLEG